MATRNLVPRATNEGQLGTTSKKWSKAFFTEGNFDTVKLGGTLISASATQINYLNITI